MMKRSGSTVSFRLHGVKPGLRCDDRGFVRFCDWDSRNCVPGRYPPYEVESCPGLAAPQFPRACAQWDRSGWFRLLHNLFAAAFLARVPRVWRFWAMQSNIWPMSTRSIRQTKDLWEMRILALLLFRRLNR